MEPLDHPIHASPVEAEPGPDGSLILWFDSDAAALAFIAETYMREDPEMLAGHGLACRCPALNRPGKVAVVRSAR